MKLCSIERCNRAVGANGQYCWSHYKRYLLTKNMPDKKCIIVECEQLAQYGVLCKEHYIPKEIAICTESGCTYLQIAGGLCLKHYRRRKKSGK